MLPVARRDLERLRHILMVLPRLGDPALPPRVTRGIVHRPSFIDALTWLDVFGDDRDLAERWRQLLMKAPTNGGHPNAGRITARPSTTPDMPPLQRTRQPRARLPKAT